MNYNNHFERTALFRFSQLACIEKITTKMTLIKAITMEKLYNTSFLPFVILRCNILNNSELLVMESKSVIKDKTNS